MYVCVHVCREVCVRMCVWMWVCACGCVHVGAQVWVRKCGCACGEGDLGAALLVEMRAKFGKFEIVKIVVADSVEGWELISLHDVPHTTERRVSLRCLHLEPC